MSSPQYQADTRAAVVEQVRVWRRRRRRASLVRIVSVILSLVLFGIAIALLLGQFSMMREDYQPLRHVPGTDGSISIVDAGTYVLVRHEGELPECTITDAEGYELLQEPWRFESDPPTVGATFYAEEGRYEVTCEGGQDGVVALNENEYEASLRGPWDLRKPSIPLFISGLVLFFGGKMAAARIAPERERPLYDA